MTATFVSYHYHCQGGYVFTPIRFFFVRQCEYFFVKIILKLSRRLFYGSGKRPFNFGADPDQGEETQMFLSPRGNSLIFLPILRE